MSRPPRTLQRLERILTMVPWLLDNPGVSVDEVTARFGVPRAQLVDDLDVLGYCGLPGYGGGDLIEASVVGNRIHVRLAEFFARPLRLSVREALTLLLAARALAGVQALPESGALRRAVKALEAALGVDAANVAVDLTGDGDELLAPLRAAVDNGEVVTLTYRSASKAELTTRDVEPWAVVGFGGAWYLQGWCRMATAPRDFRVDRIRRLEPTGTPVALERGHELRTPVYHPGPDDLTVELALAAGAEWIADEVVADEVVDVGGQRRLRLRTASPEWVARLVVRLGGLATVVAPDSLAERVRELAAATLDGYRAELPRPGEPG